MAQEPREQPSQRPATAEKRQQIVKAAVEIFGARGYEKGTLADIAEQVGITHAGVLHHFGSKQKLLLEVLDYRDRADTENFVSHSLPSGADLFLHFVKTAIRNAQREGIVQVFTVLSADSVTEDHPARPYFIERYVTLRRLVREAFEELCEQEGVTDPQRVSEATASVLAVMDGLQLQWLLDPETIDLGEATAFAIRAIVNGVIAPGPELEEYSRRKHAASDGS